MSYFLQFYAFEFSQVDFSWLNTGKKKTYIVNEGDNFKLFESREHPLTLIDHIELPSINSGSYIVL